MAGKWDQGLFNAALASKVRNQTIQTGASAQQALADARLRGQQALTAVPLAQSQIKLEGTAGMLNSANAFEANQRGKLVGPRAMAEINSQNSAAYLNNMQGRYVPFRAESERISAAGSYNGNTTQAVALQADRRPMDGTPPPATEWPSLIAPTPASSVDVTDYAPPPMLAVGAPTPTPIDNPNIRRPPPRMTSVLDDSTSFIKPSILGGGRLGFKRGVTSVPGKGSGDKMPAMLEPKEAVLNKHAADALGRDKIAKLNAKGNQQRAKQDAQRVSKLAQALKQIGMI